MVSTLLNLFPRVEDQELLLSDAERSYGYIPSEPVAILFLGLFGISTALHIGQAFYDRVWWLLPTAILCGIGELIGWTARLWSALDTNASDPFTIQISTTIIAPTPLLAASFIIFSRVVNEFGPEYSFIPAKYYAWLFVPCDIIALAVQGVGGGIASGADGDPEQSNRGARIMLGGIGFQFAVIIIFASLLTDFLVRVLRNAPWRPPAETRIIHTEVYFNVLDGGMVVLAIYTWNLVHPGVFLNPKNNLASKMKRIELRSREPLV
ncbi:hypothetical protein MKEN_00551300 [Mycena kentingensis (nom. inval.)]|nr:hypothetical protein MKEN_00551300 [Mycena kentingensis (nom. inval.)]